MSWDSRKVSEFSDRPFSFSDAEPFLCITDNLLGLDPGPVAAGADAGVGQFELSINSPAWKTGFQRIPLERLGYTERRVAGPRMVSEGLAWMAWQPTRRSHRRFSLGRIRLAGGDSEGAAIGSRL